MAFNIDPKTVVIASIVIPFIYDITGMDFEWHMIALGAIALYGYMTFDGNFINKAEVERREFQQFGPREPFLPPQKEYGVDLQGYPTAPTYQPPPPPQYNLPPQYPQYPQQPQRK